MNLRSGDARRRVPELLRIEPAGGAFHPAPERAVLPQRLPERFPGVVFHESEEVVTGESAVHGRKIDPRHILDPVAERNGRPDFGAVKMHAYKTNDFIDDEVFFFEKEGKVTALEAPCFYDNYKELDDYFAERGLAVTAMIVAYHMCGGTWLEGAKKYATANAIEYGVRGGGKALGDKFTAAFGSIFDPTPHGITDVIGEGGIEINGIKYVVTVTPDAFDVEIPEINAVYTHMLGHDCHSIVASAGHAEAIVAQLESYIRKGYNFILTSHYTPEDLKDAETKIAILKQKAFERKAVLPADVLEFLARDSGTDVRTLEGRLNKVIFASKLHEKPVTMELAATALNEAVSEEAETITSDKIISSICSFYKITKENLLGKSKKKELVQPRQICAFLMCEIMNIPLVSIGETLGGRDHTTIIHSREKIANLIKVNDRIAKEVEDIRNMILKK